MSSPITMGNGTYPISDQHSADSAWKLRGRSKDYTEAQVVGHIRVAVKKLGLTMPGEAPATTAAGGIPGKQMISGASRPHGFVFPSNLPPCAQCGHAANDSVHVNPPRAGMSNMAAGTWGRMVIASETHGAPERVKAERVKAERVKAERVKAKAGTGSDSPMKMPRRSHAYTSGYTSFNQSLPCLACGQPLGSSIHPAGMQSGTLPMGSNDGAYGGLAGGQTAIASDAGNTQQGTQQGDKVPASDPGTGAGPEEGYGQMVLVRHPFRELQGENTIAKPYQLCALCGFGADDEVHQNVDNDADQNLVKVTKMIGNRGVGSPQGGGVVGTGEATRAFVTSLNGRTIVSAPASLLTDPDGLPRAVAAAWEEASKANPNFMWIEGCFVEADQANRNRDFWSTNDLQIGEPTVAHGPLNWLHEERHIIGTLAAAQLVMPDETSGERAHIRSLAAVWRYLWPMEARVIAAASDDKKLWYSMECISKTVACQSPGCTHEQPYGEFMIEPATRCPHVKAGAPRRYVEPRFLGGAIIVPPKNPGWGNANATVMRQAAMMAEGQQEAFTGMTTTDAELMVASIIRYATEGNAA
jgi:hypothetical protein